MIHSVTDVQIADAYRRRWVPPIGHLHGQSLWATWDGKVLHVGLHPGQTMPAADVAQLDPELTAFVTGLPLPSAMDVLAHGVAAFARWTAAGLPIVTQAQYAARGAECKVCPFWDASARLGLGKCNHTACGCTWLKWWLATERCPAGKWPE